MRPKASRVLTGPSTVTDRWALSTRAAAVGNFSPTILHHGHPVSAIYMVHLLFKINKIPSQARSFVANITPVLHFSSQKLA